MTESQLPAPAATRLRAPSWRDRRLAVGVILVLASVLLGARVVARFDDAVPVYAASHTLSAGAPLTAADLHVVRVRLGAAQARYVLARSAPPAGRVLVRSVLSGELVPLSAVGLPPQVSARPVGVPVDAAAIDGLRPGSLVDVWVARKAAQGEGYDDPVPVASSAEVVAITRGGGVLSTSSGATIRLLVGAAVVPQLLSAVDNAARISVVPVPGSPASPGP